MITENKVFAVYIKTKNDINGNPRRGWMIYNDNGYIDFVNDGYGGRSTLTCKYPNHIETGPIPTTVSYYKAVNRRIMAKVSK